MPFCARRYPSSGEKSEPSNSYLPCFNSTYPSLTLTRCHRGEKPVSRTVWELRVCSRSRVTKLLSFVMHTNDATSFETRSNLIPDWLTRICILSHRAFVSLAFLYLTTTSVIPTTQREIRSILPHINAYLFIFFLCSVFLYRLFLEKVFVNRLLY